MSSEDPIDRAAEAIGTAIYDFVEAYMDYHAPSAPIEADTKAAEARLVEASAALKLAIATALRAK